MVCHVIASTMILHNRSACENPFRRALAIRANIVIGILIEALDHLIILSAFRALELIKRHRYLPFLP